LLAEAEGPSGLLPAESGGQLKVPWKVCRTTRPLCNGAEIYAHGIIVEAFVPVRVNKHIEHINAELKIALLSIMKTGSVSREIWSKPEPEKEARKEVQDTKEGHISSPGCVRIVSAT
jgi:hypothetical protein